ncbi:MAG TPA: TIGR02186 family protein [Albidovulum sp.]|uniref:TIGR02186 family protein n=1 Tax=Albidovulum sp. TaxID=1872424 RepID=UPI002CF07135|nr:TIGR02186 family protein [Albidovulum sp.]
MRWLVLLPLLFLPHPGVTEEVVAGLSQNSISITANFDGSDLLIYGAVKREEPIPQNSLLDVIITVEGPSEPVVVRRKSRSMGIWINTSGVEIDRAPSFYAVATSRPLADILSQTEDLRRRISTRQMIRSVGAPTEITDSAAFTEALIRLRERDALYVLKENTVELKADTLFSTDFDLPADLIEGDYRTRIFLLRDKKLVASEETSIDVRKVGLERWLFDLSRQQPVIYGLLAIVLALVAGWAASAAFRLIRN